MARLPIFPLGTVLFPGASLPLRLFEPRYLALLRDLVELPVAERAFGVVALMRGVEVGADSAVELARVGTTAQITTIRRGSGWPGGAAFSIETRGRRRFRLESYATADTPYYVGEVTWLVDDEPDPGDLRGLAAEACAAFEAYQLAVSGHARSLDVPPERLAFAMVGSVPLPVEDRQAILDCDDPAGRLRIVTRLLRREAVLFGGLRFAPAERSVFGSPSQN